jgi:hypothetical protein
MGDLLGETSGETTPVTPPVAPPVTSATEPLPVAPAVAETATRVSPDATVETTPAEGEYDWKLGDFKSEQTWQNQMLGRDWTSEQIDNMIKTGEQTPVTNYVNKGNPAMKYTDLETGRYIVRDEATKEILQISGKDFIPSK